MSAARSLTRAALRAATKQTPVARTFASAAKAAVRPTVAAVSRTAFKAQQVRGIKTVDFAGVKEDVYGKSTTQFPVNSSIRMNRLANGVVI